MTLKIEAVSKEELESEFGTDANGNDPETVKFIRTLAIGDGFKVTAEGTETDRMVKRRINACAKDAFRELDWKSTEGSKTLTARVKAIDVDAEKKAQEEEEAKKKPAPVSEDKEPEKTPEEEKTPENPPAPPQEPQESPREPVTAGSGRNKAPVA